MPLISVIIPALNAEKYLAEALDSILAQAHRPLQIIVVDDGSHDGTAQIAGDYADRGVTCLQRSNGGTAAALNTGLQEAAGELLAFLDADDLWLPEKLAIQIGVLEKQQNIEMVFSLSESFASPDLPDEMRRRMMVPQHPIEGYCKSAMLIRRAAFDRVGPFNEALRTGDFIDWYLRAKEAQVQSVLVPQVLMRRRHHASNHGSIERDRRVEYIRSLKAALDRRRAVQP